jgi:predicted CoA-binding protein
MRPGLRRCDYKIGIENGETRQIAEEGGLAYVEDLCMKNPPGNITTDERR